jgi:hypothetical protein
VWCGLSGRACDPEPAAPAAASKQVPFQLDMAQVEAMNNQMPPAPELSTQPTAEGSGEPTVQAASPDRIELNITEQEIRNLDISQVRDWGSVSSVGCRTHHSTEDRNHITLTHRARRRDSCAPGIPLALATGEPEYSIACVSCQRVPGLVHSRPPHT